MSLNFRLAQTLKSNLQRYSGTKNQDQVMMQQPLMQHQHFIISLFRYNNNIRTRQWCNSQSCDINILLYLCSGTTTTAGPSNDAAARSTASHATSTFYHFFVQVQQQQQGQAMMQQQGQQPVMQQQQGWNPQNQQMMQQQVLKWIIQILIILSIIDQHFVGMSYYLKSCPAARFKWN